MKNVIQGAPNKSKSAFQEEKVFENIRDATNKANASTLNIQDKYSENICDKDRLKI